MAIDENVRARLLELIDTGGGLSRGNEDGEVRSQEHANECVGWIAAAHHIVHTFCPTANDPYLMSAKSIVEASKTRGHWVVHDSVGELTMVLKNLSHDDELGLLVSITNRAQSEVLDDLLDQAEEYRKQDHKDGAGALASVVFEDTVRRIAKLSDGIEEGIKLNNTISALAKQGTLTSIKAKQCVAAAGVRNAALHAKWDEFEMSDVKATIELTRELLEIHLAG